MYNNENKTCCLNFAELLRNIVASHRWKMSPSDSNYHGHRRVNVAWKNRGFSVTVKPTLCRLFFSLLSPLRCFSIFEISFKQAIAKVYDALILQRFLGKANTDGSTIRYNYQFSIGQFRVASLDPENLIIISRKIYGSRHSDIQIRQRNSSYAF